MQSRAQAEDIIHTHAVAHAATAALLAPTIIGDKIALTALTYNMVGNLADIYDVENVNFWKVLSQVAGYCAGMILCSTILCFIPGIGSAANAIATAVVTETIGWTYVSIFESNRDPSTVSNKELKGIVSECKTKAEKHREEYEKLLEEMTDSEKKQFKSINEKLKNKNISEVERNELSRSLHDLYEAVDNRYKGIQTVPDASVSEALTSDKKTEIRILAAHKAPINAIAVTPDEQYVISASADNDLKIWDLESGNLLHTLSGHSAPVNSVVVTSDGRHAVSASADNDLKIWDLESGNLLRTLSGHSAPVNSVVVTPDERHAVSASGDFTIKIWDLESGNELHTLTGHTWWVNSVVLTFQGEYAISASGDCTLKVWNLEKGNELHTLTGHSSSVTTVAVTADGNKAISASEDGTLRVWDLQKGRQLDTLNGHTKWVRAIVLTANTERVISVSEDATINVWNLENGNSITTFEGGNPFRSCSLGLDGSTFISGDESGTLYIIYLDRIQANDTVFLAE